MKITEIQWCHSTVNPVMGCDGCELWPKNAQFVAGIARILPPAPEIPAELLRSTVRRALNDRETSEAYRDRELVADKIQSDLRLPDGQRQAIVDVIRSLAKCYAGLLGTMRTGHKGYADKFESPKL